MMTLLQKETYTSAIELSKSAKEPCIYVNISGVASTTSNHFALDNPPQRKEPYISAKGTYKSAKEPYIYT